MRRALLIIAILIGVFLTIGCTSPESDDEMEGDDEPSVEDDDLGIDESFGTVAEDSDDYPNVQGTGDSVT
ncbi:MAG: hypothetical protein SCH66_02160 [Methanolobus sp.]|nr:hypothetical protein [Methanolobus sp.]MDW7731213.1 hypothetical protein [Methanolobus sp.]